MRVEITRVLSLCCFLVLQGCAVASRESVFSHVQSDVLARSGYEPSYAPDESEVDARVKAYFEDGITADEAVRIALLNNQELQAAYEKLGVRRGELIEAGLLANPVFEAEVRFEGSGIGAGTNLSLVQEFISIFQLPLRRSIAEKSLEAAKHEVTAKVLDLIFETESAYYSLQGAEQVLDLRRTIVEALEASAEIARRQRRAGNITALQSLGEAALHARARRDLAVASAEAYEAREDLSILMGLFENGGEWKIPARLPEPAPEVLSRSRLEALALERRPELLQARHEIEALADELGISRGFRLLPELELGVDAEGEDDGGVTFGPNLALPLPIFNQGQGRIAQGEARVREARRLYLSQAVKVRSDVRRSLNRLAAAQEQIDFDRKHLIPLAQELVRNTQLEYNAMLVGVFDLLKAKQEQIEAGKAYIEALRDYWIARSQLKKAIGGEIELVGNVAPAAESVADRKG